MLTNLVLVTYEHLHQILSKSAQFSVLVNVALALVSETEMSRQFGQFGECSHSHSF